MIVSCCVVLVHTFLLTHRVFSHLILISKQALTEKVLEILQSFPDSPHPPPAAVIRNKITPNIVTSLVNDAKSALMEDLYLVGCTDEGVFTECNVLVGPTISWVYEMYVQGIVGMAGGGLKSNNNSTLSNVNTAKPAAHGKEDYLMRAIDSAEETVWCGLLGMKGQVDMIAKARWLQPANLSITNTNTTSTTTTTSNANKHSTVEPARALTVQDVQVMQDRALPVEIKTGKWRAGTVLGHRAQVHLAFLCFIYTDLYVLPISKWYLQSIDS